VLARYEGITEDAYEDNDSKETVDGQPAGGADSPNLGVLATERVIGNLAMADAYDWFRFSMPGEGTAADFVRIDFEHDWGDLDLYVYASDGTTVVGASGASGDSEMVSLNGQRAGTYYVMVYGYRGARNPNYTLTIDPADGTPLLAEATAASGVLTSSPSAAKISKAVQDAALADRVVSDFAAAGNASMAVLPATTMGVEPQSRRALVRSVRVGDTNMEAWRREMALLWLSRANQTRGTVDDEALAWRDRRGNPSGNDAETMDVALAELGWGGTNSLLRVDWDFLSHRTA
jgi:hypothetical protein